MLNDKDYLLIANCVEINVLYNSCVKSVDTLIGHIQNDDVALLFARPEAIEVLFD